VPLYRRFTGTLTLRLPTSRLPTTNSPTNLQSERDEEWEVEECDEAGEAEQEADELEAEFVRTGKAGEDGGGGTGGGGAVALRPHTDGMLLSGGHVQILKKYFVQYLYTGNLLGPLTFLRI
jgi:hypothetical protein